MARGSSTAESKRRPPQVFGTRAAMSDDVCMDKPVDAKEADIRAQPQCPTVVSIVGYSSASSSSKISKTSITIGDPFP